MIINKIVQSLAKNFSSSNNIRPTLASVYFTKNKAVATDSFKLCEIEFLKNEITQDDLKFQDFEYKKYDENFLIHKDDFLKLQIPNFKSTNQLNKFFIGKGNNGEIELKSFDFSKYQTIKTSSITGTFPNYESFFKNYGIREIGISPDYVIEIMQLYKKAKVRSVKMILGNPLEPIIFEAHNSEDYLKENDIKNIKSILMPIKL